MRKVCSHCALQCCPSDAVGFSYCVGLGTRNVLFDAPRSQVRAFDWSYLCVMCITVFILMLRQRSVCLR